MDGCLSVHVNVKALQVTLSKCNHFKFKVPKKQNMQRSTQVRRVSQVSLLIENISKKLYRERFSFNIVDSKN